MKDQENSGLLLEGALKVVYESGVVVCEIRFTFEGIIVSGEVIREVDYWKYQTDYSRTMDAIDIARAAGSKHDYTATDRTEAAIQEYQIAVRNTYETTKGNTSPTSPFIYLQNVVLNSGGTGQEAAFWRVPLAGISSIFEVGPFKPKL